MLPSSKFAGNLDVGDEEEVEHSAGNVTVIGSKGNGDVIYSG